MNRKDLIEELHKLKEAITLVSDRVNEVEKMNDKVENLIDQFNNNM